MSQRPPGTWTRGEGRGRGEGEGGMGGREGGGKGGALRGGCTKETPVSSVKLPACSNHITTSLCYRFHARIFHWSKKKKILFYFIFKKNAR